MAIDVLCPCGKTLRAPDHLAGRRVRCAHCGAKSRVPNQPTESYDALAVPPTALAAVAEEQAAAEARLAREALRSGADELRRVADELRALLAEMRETVRELGRIVEARRDRPGGGRGDVQ